MTNWFAPQSLEDPKYIITSINEEQARFFSSFAFGSAQPEIYNGSYIVSKMNFKQSLSTFEIPISS